MTSPATSLEVFYVVDTHALIWYLLNDQKVSQRAKAIFQAAEQNQTLLVISAIVVAELYYANLKNKWFADFVQLYANLICDSCLLTTPIFWILCRMLVYRKCTIVLLSGLPAD